mmetsp:Transcript_37139/g.66245  ORF Transcript_37139/g.66245 Transcript_37139/m.66245 type:complete len:236 (-) Transcript_37139:1682-2389(-)
MPADVFCSGVGLSQNEETVPRPCHVAMAWVEQHTAPEGIRPHADRQDLVIVGIHAVQHVAKRAEVVPDEVDVASNLIDLVRGTLHVLLDPQVLPHYLLGNVLLTCQQVGDQVVQAKGRSRGRQQLHAHLIDADDTGGPHIADDSLVPGQENLDKDGHPLVVLADGQGGQRGLRIRALPLVHRRRLVTQHEHSLATRQHGPVKVNHPHGVPLEPTGLHHQSLRPEHQLHGLVGLLC